MDRPAPHVEEAAPAEAPARLADALYDLAWGFLRGEVPGPTVRTTARAVSALVQEGYACADGIDIDSRLR